MDLMSLINFEKLKGMMLMQYQSLINFEKLKGMMLMQLHKQRVLEVPLMDLLLR